MKKIVVFLFSFFFFSPAFAGITLSNQAYIVGTVDATSLQTVEKVVFPNNANGTYVNASVLVSNPNADLPLNGNFWIKSLSDPTTGSSGWVTFNHGVGTQAMLKNNGDNTFDVDGYAWSRSAGWISFNTGVTGGKVVYNRTTGLFSGSAWSKNIGWIPFDGLKLVTSAPELVPSTYVFEANNNKTITIGTPADTIDITIDNFGSGDTYYNTKTFVHNFQTAKLYTYSFADRLGNSNTGYINVVAAAPDVSRSSFVFSSGSKKADGVEKNTVDITLRDRFNNSVVNVPGVKELRVNLAFNNDVDLDQVQNLDTGNAVVFSSPEFPMIIGGINHSGTNTTSTTGVYHMDISSYAPTYTSYPDTTITNEINLSELSYEVRPLGSYTTVGETVGKQYRYGGPQPEAPNMLFTAIFKVTGVAANPSEIIRDLENEYTVNTYIDSTINNPNIQHILDLGSNLTMSFKELSASSTETEICAGYNTKNGYIGSGDCDLSGNNWSSNIKMQKNGTISSAYISKFKATSKINYLADPFMPAIYSSTVSYTNTGRNIKYGSLTSTFGEAYNPEVKIAGIANSGFEVSNISNNTVLGTSLSRAQIREIIAKNVANWTKSGTPPSNVAYYTSDTTIGAWPAGKDTIVVDGGDLYITGNIVKSAANKLNAIVVLNNSGNGGNVWVNKSVKFISAVIFADRHMISGEMPTNTYYADSQTAAQDQLFYKGSILSYNTIGGASKSPAECPYPIASCNGDVARRYDLNHFRHYINLSSTVIGTPMTPGAYGADNVNMSLPGYVESPMIIEYDSSIQTNLPSIFTN